MSGLELVTARANGKKACLNLITNFGRLRRVSVKRTEKKMRTIIKL